MSDDFVEGFLTGMSGQQGESRPEPQAESIEVPGKGEFYLYSYYDPGIKVGGVFLVDPSAKDILGSKKDIAEIVNSPELTGKYGKVASIKSLTYFGKHGVSIGFYDPPKDSLGNSIAEGALGTLLDPSKKNPLRASLREALRSVVAAKVDHLHEWGYREKDFIIEAETPDNLDKIDVLLETVVDSYPHSPVQSGDGEGTFIVSVPMSYFSS